MRPTRLKSLYTPDPHLPRAIARPGLQKRHHQHGHRYETPVRTRADLPGDTEPYSSDRKALEDAVQRWLVSLPDPRHTSALPPSEPKRRSASRSPSLGEGVFEDARIELPLGLPSSRERRKQAKVSKGQLDTSSKSSKSKKSLSGSVFDFNPSPVDLIAQAEGYRKPNTVLTGIDTAVLQAVEEGTAAQPAENATARVPADELSDAASTRSEAVSRASSLSSILPVRLEATLDLSHYTTITPAALAISPVTSEQKINHFGPTDSQTFRISESFSPVAAVHSDKSSSSETSQATHENDDREAGIPLPPAGDERLQLVKAPTLAQHKQESPPLILPADDATDADTPAAVSGMGPAKIAPSIVSSASTALRHVSLTEQCAMRHPDTEAIVTDSSKTRNIQRAKL